MNPPNDTPPASPTGQNRRFDTDEPLPQRDLDDMREAGVLAPVPPPESQATPVTAEDAELASRILRNLPFVYAKGDHQRLASEWIAAHVAARNAAALARVEELEADRKQAESDWDSECLELMARAEKAEAALAEANRTCAELVTDSNAVTLAQSLQRMSAQLTSAREELDGRSRYIGLIEQKNSYLTNDRDDWKARAESAEAQLVTANAALAAERGHSAALVQGIEESLMHLDTNYCIDGLPMKDSDAAIEMRRALMAYDYAARSPSTDGAAKGE